MFLHLEVRTRWWLPVYLRSVALVSALMGTEPDLERVGRWVVRGLVVRVFEVHAAVLA